jgi:23S rRNA pseudouridine1911/1915/1917 synthase
VSPRPADGNPRPAAWRALAVGSPGRLDAFLAAALPHLSRRHLVQLIAEGRVRLHGAAAGKGTAVRHGDVVEVDAELVEVRALRPQPRPALPIVYLDEYLVAIDKPCGVASVAQSVLDLGTAANFLIAACPETAALDGRGLEAGFVHRLDTATSGVLLAARRADVHRTLRDRFRRQVVVKRYRTLVAGEVRGGGACNAPIRNKPGDPRRVEIVREARADRQMPVGRAAETRFRALAAGPQASLLEVEIHSGARHQIRAHLAAIGHPIVGDDLYGGPPAHRLMLHAHEIALDHPASGQPTTIRATPPPELQGLA